MKRAMQAGRPFTGFKHFTLGIKGIFNAIFTR
jgi:hypothetical protein